jgi:DNA-binding response OmpR family regulator
MNPANKKILIAEDDSSIRLVLSQAFTRLGYQVRATGNVTTLMKWVAEGEGDLIITDVVMPDENVFNVLPRIRKDRPKLPVIVLSAQNTLLTAVNAADAGAFEYVSKPFDLDDVTAAARRALSRPADSEASKAQARALTAIAGNKSGAGSRPLAQVAPLMTTASLIVRKAALQSVHESEILPREKIITALEEANLKKKTKMADKADPEGANSNFSSVCGAAMTQATLGALKQQQIKTKARKELSKK